MFRLFNKAVQLNVQRYGEHVSRYQYSKQPGFVGKLIDNIRNEFSKNKEMKDNIAKFREEAQKLEESDALKQARRKFQIVESEASKGSEVFKEQMDSVKEKLQQVAQTASQSEFAKKAGEVGEQIGKQAQNMAGSMAEHGSKLASTPPFRAVSGAAAVVRDELVDVNSHSRIYKPPVKLRKRVEIVGPEQIIQANEEATGVELHKDSRFYQSWEQFKDNNPYVNKVLDWKIKYDESDNPIVRASRLLTEKVSDIMGGLFQRTEMSEALTEIIQLDPSFDKEKFLRDCEQDIIPNILEACCRSDLEILQDWCYEKAFAIMAQPIKAAKELGMTIETRVLDISQVDLAMGRVLEQGPVLVITFTAQQVQFVRDKAGKVTQGDPEKVLRVNNVWVMCRDRTELNPRAAWRLLEYAQSASEQLV